MSCCHFRFAVEVVVLHVLTCNSRRNFFSSMGLGQQSLHCSDMAKSTSNHKDVQSDKAIESDEAGLEASSDGSNDEDFQVTLTPHNLGSIRCNGSGLSIRLGWLHESLPNLQRDRPPRDVIRSLKD